MLSRLVFALSCFASCLVATHAFIAPGGLALRSPASNARLSISRPQVARAAGSITMQSGDDSKLFVGGIPWALTSDDLRQAFSEFGSISDANVVFDRETGRSKGFGFVTFGDRASAEKALAAMNQAEIGGRTINVNFAQPREPREGGFRGGRGGRGGRSNAGAGY